MRFELQLAFRHLRAGGWQTVLIVCGVAVAVTLTVFISGLITGLQRRLVSTVTDSIAHVTLSAPERAPRVAADAPGISPGATVIANSQQRIWQPDVIDKCRCIEAQLALIPQITSVSPGVTGQALIQSAGNEASVVVLGGNPTQQDPISNLSQNMVEGSYLGLGGSEVVVTYTLAEDFQLSLGDRVRLTTAAGETQTFRVGGIADTGRGGVSGSPVFVTLRAAQSLFSKGTAVTSISLRVADVFSANRIGDMLEAGLGLQADTWMRDNVSLLAALRAQSSSSLLISVFSLLASGFAVASVLIVSVLKRSREIGILKAMGAKPAQILRVFTFEGLIIGICGSSLGALIGGGLITALSNIKQPPTVPGQAPSPVFPGIVTIEIIVVTMAAGIIIATIASVLPARQAASLDPVEVISRG